MFSFEQTLAAKALEEQQLHDHEPELGDKTPLLGGFAPALSSFEVTNRYAALEYLCRSSRQLCASDFTCIVLAHHDTCTMRTDVLFLHLVCCTYAKSGVLCSV